MLQTVTVSLNRSNRLGICDINLGMSVFQQLGFENGSEDLGTKMGFTGLWRGSTMGTKIQSKMGFTVCGGNKNGNFGGNENGQIKGMKTVNENGNESETNEGKEGLERKWVSHLEGRKVARLEGTKQNVRGNENCVFIYHTEGVKTARSLKWYRLQIRHF